MNTCHFYMSFSFKEGVRIINVNDVEAIGYYDPKGRDLCNHGHLYFRPKLV